MTEILEKRAALVLEGGAMRGVFTTGVLDAFSERDCFFEKIVSVSAGSLQALSYVSRQPGRNRRVNLTYCADSRYMGLRHWLFDDGYFNFKFIFGELSHKLDPFDYEAFSESAQEMSAVVTDLETGAARFISSHDYDAETYMVACEASATIPLISKPILFDGRQYVDGGVALPVAPLPSELPFPPKKTVYVLTRNRGYRKKPVGASGRRFTEFCLRKHPKAAELMMTIPERYNARLSELERLEAEGKVFLIRPEKPVTVTRAEKNAQKLSDFYDEGRQIAGARFEDMMTWLSK